MINGNTCPAEDNDEDSGLTMKRFMINQRRGVRVEGNSDENDKDCAVISLTVEI